MSCIKDYIRLLGTVNNSLTPFHINDNNFPSESDRQLLKELAKDGYIDGEPKYGGDAGKTLMILGASSTIKGRVFQEELEQKLINQTFKGRILKHLPITIAVVLGFFFNTILEILKKYIL